ncbi:Chloroperoxidase [Rhizoctonia solani]|nr:Chloroperoxidase [Rhizoctonia solani]
MRPLLATVTIALTASTVALPSMGGLGQNEAAGCPFANAVTSKRQSNVAPLATFDPVKQKIDVTGEHAFKPPVESDKRGPCPGLNALANHGYLPHNGVTNLIEAATVCNKVFGMGIEISTVLSMIATVFDGNPLTGEWSIGGSPEGPVLPPLLSAPQGLSGSHNKYEGDSSPARFDAYMNNGDASTMNLTYFKQLYDLLPEGDPEANFDYDTIVKNRAMRFKTSISENPHFFYGPFTGLIASAAAHAFVTRLMSNHSEEAPDGILNHETLKSFFGVSGSSTNLTYQIGYERIPDIWYRRPTDYIIPQFDLDLVNAGLKHPEFLSVGGNIGKVNSFAGVNVGNLTGGAYTAATLLQGNNLVCFGFQAAQQAIPDVLKGIPGGQSAALSLWTSKVTPISSSLGCPELTKYDGSVFKTYPRSGDGAF